MSSQHYTAQWKFAQAELRQLLNDELPPARPKSEIPVDGTGDAVPKPQHEPIADRIEVIKLLKSRFVKYLRSVKRLDECYDQILQPQKRRLIKLPRVQKRVELRIFVFFFCRSKSDCFSFVVKKSEMLTFLG